METGKKRFSENANLEIRGNFAEINLGKVRVALLHGGEEELLRALIKGWRLRHSGLWAHPQGGSL
jgi:hypothetical protein